VLRVARHGLVRPLRLLLGLGQGLVGLDGAGVLGHPGLEEELPELLAVSRLEHGAVLAQDRVGLGRLRLHRLCDQPLQRLDRHRLARVGPAHLRQGRPREPRELPGQALGDGCAGLGGEGVTVEVLLDRLAEDLQGVEHRALGDVLLLLGHGALQGGDRVLVTKPAEPLGGLGAHIALAVGQGGDDALLLVGDRRQGVLGGPAVGFVSCERDLEQGVDNAARERGQRREGAVGPEPVDGVVAFGARQESLHGVEVVGDEGRHVGVGPVPTEHVAPG